MVQQRHISVGSVLFSNESPLALIAGPCVIESKEHSLFMARSLKEIAERLGIGLVFKTSFDKANRLSGKSYRGIDLEEALPIFDSIRKLGLPVVTDVHTPEQCLRLKDHVDMLQTPALLCRQTDLLVAAGETGLPINVKKGQFLSPQMMLPIAAKIAATGNEKILLCERGTSFGYGALVNDMRGLEIMASTGYPVVFDATHSVQQPGGGGDKTGGERQYVATLAKAAVAVGVAAVFLETHQDPDHAPSDGPNMVPLHEFETLVKKLMAIDKVVKA